MLQELTRLYQENNTFHEDLRETTKEVITNQGTTLEMEKALDIGVTFILQELACILNATNIFKVKSCPYVYHQEMPVHVKLLNKQYPFEPPQNGGYIIAKAKNRN